MVLTAYLDDSGTHKESPYVAIAGAIGPETAWARLTLAWDAEYRKEKIQVFHRTDCHARERAFKGWSVERADGLVSRLIDAFLATDDLVGIGACLRRADYERMVPEDKRKRVGFPTLLCLRHAIHRVDEFAGIDADAKIGVIFESSEQYASKGRDLFYALREEDRWKDRLISFTDHPKEQFIPLQVADLIVWELVKQLNSTLTYEAGPEGFKRLDRSQVCKFTIFDHIGLAYHLQRLGIEPADSLGVSPLT
jgi:hypothetical protein